MLSRRNMLLGLFAAAAPAILPPDNLMRLRGIILPRTLLVTGRDAFGRRVEEFITVNAGYSETTFRVIDSIIASDGPWRQPYIDEANDWIKRYPSPILATRERPEPPVIGIGPPHSTSFDLRADGNAVVLDLFAEARVAGIEKI